MGEQLQEQEVDPIFLKVQELASGLLEIDPSVITDESAFAELDLDSLDMVEVVTELGDDTGVDVEQKEFRDELKKSETVGQLVHLFRTQAELLA